MITPANKLTQVYKIVQIDTAGRLWSVNTHLRYPSEQLIEYLFNHQVFPNDKTKALFAFPDYKTVMACLYIYGERHVKVLRCLAHNVRTVNCDSFNNDYAIAESIDKGFNSRYDFYFPAPTISGALAKVSLCEWLIPLNFVKIPQKFLTSRQS